MRAIILAAGRGSRMGQATEAKPKCLTELAGQPLLAWQLAALRSAGMEQVALVTGYRAEILANRADCTFHNPRWAETNMVMSLAAAAPWLTEAPCLVSYSDIVYRPATIRALMAAEGDLTITYDRLWQALWQARFEDPLADAETFKTMSDGRLATIGERATSLAEIEGQYMGLLRFTPAGWSRVASFLDGLAPEVRDRLDMTSLIRQLLAHGEDVQTVSIDGGWCEVDSEQDARLYERCLQQSGGWSHDWRN